MNQYCDNDVKQIKKIFFIYLIIAFIIIFILENLIQMKFSYRWSCSFLLGGIANIICFLITEKAVNQIGIKDEKRIRIFFISVNILKLCIYALILLIVGFLILKYGVFLAAFGMISIKIIISFKYLIIERIKDNIRLIDDLDIDKSMQNKLKLNGITKVKQLVLMNRNDLNSYLSIDEIEVLSLSLRKYGLFLKGELEVIEDDDDKS